MKIYIAGKISGLPYDEALQKFERAEHLLRSLGHEPVSPIRENPLDGDCVWAEYMKRDIPHLLKCDAIFLLDDWQDSKGAKLEHLIAHELGLEVLTTSYLSAGILTQNGKR